MSVFIIGLTGGIVSGKTSVAIKFRELGAKIIDADKIAREIVQPGEAAWKKIVHYFGHAVLLDNNQINRAKLAVTDVSGSDNTNFNNPQAMAELNKITHPIIIDHIKIKIAELKRNNMNKTVCIVDAPLIYETGIERLMDKIIVVYISKSEQINRLIKRDKMTREEAVKKIESQISIEKKREWADYIIDNQSSFEETEQQIKKIWHDIFAIH